MKRREELKEIDRILKENKKLINDCRRLMRTNSQLIDENIRLRRVLYRFAKAGFKNKTIPGWYFYEVHNDK